jgi:hypothetical protein
MTGRGLAGTGWGGPQAAWLPDGVRLHLHQGPIDLILWADAGGRQVAYECAVRAFHDVLEKLVEELPALRSPAPVTVSGPVAQAMAAAVAPYAALFVTPMAAVAGAVADHVLAAMVKGAPGLRKAWVNNGGDIAIHLTGGQAFDAAMPGGRLTIRATDPSRGVATSGWRGRSQSLGIADAVTILAPTAAMADAAATLIANAVDLPGHPAVTRRPAVEIKADSDLGHRLVTTAVAPLTPPDRGRALAAGLAVAEDFRVRGLIHAAHLALQGDRAATAAKPEMIHA